MSYNFYEFGLHEAINTVSETCNLIRLIKKYILEGKYIEAEMLCDSALKRALIILDRSKPKTYKFHEHFMHTPTEN